MITRLLHWLQTRSERFSPPFDRSVFTMEDDVDAAVDTLREQSWGEEELGFIAGVRSVGAMEKPPSKDLSNLSRDQLYKLAAAKLLAKQAKWNLPLLQMYACTGYQKLLLPDNPRFAFVQKGDGPLHSLFNSVELRLWLQEATDADLLRVEKWFSEEVQKGDPALHGKWVYALGTLQVDRLLHIRELLFEHRDVSGRGSITFCRAIEEHLKDRLTFGNDGTINVPNLFTCKLGDGMKVHVAP